MLFIDPGSGRDLGHVNQAQNALREALQDCSLRGCPRRVLGYVLLDLAAEQLVHALGPSVATGSLKRTSSLVESGIYGRGTYHRLADRVA
jgi:hypothetical protein